MYTIFNNNAKIQYYHERPCSSKNAIDYVKNTEFDAIYIIPKIYDGFNYVFPLDPQKMWDLTLKNEDEYDIRSIVADLYLNDIKYKKTHAVLLEYNIENFHRYPDYIQDKTPVFSVSNEDDAVYFKLNWNLL